MTTREVQDYRTHLPLLQKQIVSFNMSITKIKNNNTVLVLYKDINSCISLKSDMAQLTDKSGSFDLHHTFIYIPFLKYIERTGQELALMNNNYRQSCLQNHLDTDSPKTSKRSLVIFLRSDMYLMKRISPSILPTVWLNTTQGIVLLL